MPELIIAILDHDLSIYVYMYKVTHWGAGLLDYKIYTMML